MSQTSNNRNPFRPAGTRAAADTDAPWPAEWEPADVDPPVGVPAHSFRPATSSSSDAPIWRPIEPAAVRLIERTTPEGWVVLQSKAVYIGAVGAGFWAILSASMALVGALDSHPHGKYDRIVALAIFGPMCLLALWVAYRSATSRVRVDGTGLHIRNLFSSRSVAWAEVAGFSSEYCRCGEGGGSWRVMVSLRSTDRKVGIGGLAFICLFGSGAQKKADASVARLESLALRRP